MTRQRLAIAAVTRLFDEVGLSSRRLALPWRRGVGGPANGAPALQLVEEPERVAYLLVRIVESLCFAELAGTAPDVDLAEQTIRDMLVRACTPRQSRLSRLMDAGLCVVWTSIPNSLFAESGLPMAFAAA